MIDHILLIKSLVDHIAEVKIAHTPDLAVSDHWPVILDLTTAH